MGALTALANCMCLHSSVCFKKFGKRWLKPKRYLRRDAAQNMTALASTVFCVSLHHMPRFAVMCAVVMCRRVVPCGVAEHAIGMCVKHAAGPKAATMSKNSKEHWPLWTTEQFRQVRCLVRKRRVRLHKLNLKCTRLKR